MQKVDLTPEERMIVIDRAMVGRPFWSLLRVYVGFKLFDGQSAIEGNSPKRFKVFSSWSLSQLLSVFQRKKFLFTGNASDLLKLNEVFYHRLFYSTIELLGEKDCNVLLKGSHPDGTIAKPVYGSSFLFEAASYLFSYLIRPIIFFRYSYLRVELQRFNVDINVVQIISYHKAAYILWRGHFLIKKPQKIFLSDWYNAFQMALIRAAKKAGIETIEFQHGMVSQGHYGYFYYSQGYDPQFNADRFFCFGPHFANLLAKNSVYRPDQTILIGHPTLDLYSTHKASKEGIRVLVTLQDLILEQTMAFVEKAAAQLPHVEFWLLPRRQVPQSRASNIKVLQAGKFYELVQNVHIHATVFSSTAYEALYFGCPNILINIDNLSMRFLSDLTGQKANAYLINSPMEFKKAIEAAGDAERDAIFRASEDYFSRNHQVQLKKYFHADR